MCACVHVNDMHARMQPYLQKVYARRYKLASAHAYGRTGARILEYAMHIHIHVRTVVQKQIDTTIN